MWQIKYSPAKVWFFSLVALAVILLSLLVYVSVSDSSKDVPSAKALGNSGYTVQHTTGGSECHGYTSENAPIAPVYDYCQQAQGKPSPTATITEIVDEIVHRVHDKVTATVTAVVTATKIATSTPSETPTGTPTPVITATPTETQVETPTPTSTTTSTPPATEVSKTPKPTKTATPSPTPKPTKVCPNKNDDKKPGENPTDCNAGGGNG